MNILITGASSGIGRQLALYYLRQGHQVTAVARRTAQLAELYQETEVAHGSLVTYCADVTDQQRMAAVVMATEQEVGPLNLVIANAGIAMQHLSANLKLNDFEQVLQTNVMGVFNTIVPAINIMLSRGNGQVACISSLAALYAIPRMSPYCAAKVALNYQLAGLYWSLKPHGIHVTTICPGFIETEMTIAQQVPISWCISMDHAISQITQAIARKHRLYFFPLRQYLPLKLLSLLPPPVADRIFHRISARNFPPPSFMP
jgi:short-subunit dehydrogenase